MEAIQLMATCPVDDGFLIRWYFVVEPMMAMDEPPPGNGLQSNHAIVHASSIEEIPHLLHVLGLHGSQLDEQAWHDIFQIRCQPNQDVDRGRSLHDDMEVDAFLVHLGIDELHVILEHAVRGIGEHVIPRHVANVVEHVSAEETDARYIKLHVFNDVVDVELIVTRFDEMPHES